MSSFASTNRTPPLDATLFDRATASIGLADDPRLSALEPSFAALFQELKRWGEAINLTGKLNETVFVQDHMADSLVADSLIPSGSRVVDLGTGAGFPGLPLAMLNPECDFALLDRTRKKIGFIKHMVSVLGLKNVQAQWKDWAQWEEGPADVLLCRAVYSDTDWLKTLAESPLWNPKARLLWWRSEETAAELPAGFHCGERLWYRLPGREWRVVEVLERPENKA